MGPSTKPMKEIAMPSPMSEGTSHTISSRLFVVKRTSNPKIKKHNTPNSQGSVNENHQSLPNLKKIRFEEAKSALNPTNLLNHKRATRPRASPLNTRID